MAAQKQFTTSAGSHLKNREIFYGPDSPGTTPYTWSVPSGTTEVHVHVWGGGGAGHYASWSGAGGGGGGYARAPYTVTDSDTLSITVGSAAASSSVTIPTQAPTSPVSATNGSIGSVPGNNGGPGGSGAVTLNPTFPQYYCMTADGGCGGWKPSPAYPGPYTGSGGAAGSPLGTGGDGGWGCSNFGGGIGQAPGFNRHCQRFAYCIGGAGPYTQEGTITNCHGGNYLTGRKSGCYSNPDNYNNYSPAVGPIGDYATIVLGSVGRSNFMENIKTCWHCWNQASYTLSTCPGAMTRTYSGPEANTSRGDEWFWVEDMAGSGGYQYTSPVSDANMGDAGAGAGGGANGQAGILGGGSQCSSTTWALPTSAGYGGGGGSNGSAPPQGPLTGGAGLVILYW